MIHPDVIQHKDILAFLKRFGNLLPNYIINQYFLGCRLSAGINRQRFTGERQVYH